MKIENLTINISMKCNMRCSYCYVFSEELEEESRKEVLTLDEIYNILEGYAKNKSKDQSAGKIIDITWHGGEPLLCGIKFFEEIINLERKIYNKYGVFSRNRIQTNATLINNNWISFFDKYKFSVGVSLDGPDFVHSENRYYQNKISSFNETIQGINLLKTNKIPFGILCVVTNDSYKYSTEIYEFFSDLNVSSVDFIPSYLPYVMDSCLKPEYWSEFLINIYKRWIKELKFDIPYFSDIIKKINCLRKGKDYHNESLLCELTDICGNNPSITSDGNLYFCECLIGMEEYKVGSVKFNKLDELFESKQIDLKIEEINKISTQCLKCEFYNICEGGCLKHRLYTDVLKTNVDYFCYGKKKIFSHIMNTLFEDK